MEGKKNGEIETWSKRYSIEKILVRFEDDYLNNKKKIYIPFNAQLNCK